MSDQHNRHVQVREGTDDLPQTYLVIGIVSSMESGHKVRLGRL
jgi:hypothetical protein